MINALFVFWRYSKKLNVATKKKPDSGKVTIQTPNEAVKPVTPDIFTNLGNKAPLVALGLILLIGFIVFKDFILFDKVYLFKDIGSDTFNYAYPYAHNVAEYISKHGIPKWSFNFGIGQNLFPFFLRDPFDVIVYIAGKDHLYGAFFYREFLKIILGGLVFFYYLKELKMSDYVSIIGAITFSYCGFMIVGSGWYIFAFEAFNMALMLLAFEQLFSSNKWQLFVLAIFLICISQPFNLFVYGVFLLFYVFLRHFQTGTFSAKNIGLILGKMIALGVLAMLISAPFLIENCVQLLESPRGGGVNSYANLFSNAPMFAVSEITELGTSVMRFFSSDLLGTGNEYKGWGNTLEAGMFYCGLSSLVLMPQVFQFLSRKVKISFAVVIGVWIVMLILPYFRYAFWLFTGNYFRAYSAILGFFFMYYSLVALDLILKHKKVNLIVLIGTMVALFALLNYPYFPDSEIISHGILLFVSIMLMVYGVLVFLMGRQDSPAYLKYVYMVAVALELAFLSSISVNDRDTELAANLSQKKGYNDYTVEAVDYLHKKDQSFYRIDKVYASSPAMHFSINDGMAQSYMGTSSYSPFNQVYYVLYLQQTGISRKENELQSRWAIGVAYRPILESELQVKYILAKGPINPIQRAACDSITSFGDVRIYQNKYVIPFGPTYEYYIKDSIYRTLSNDQKDYISLRACVVGDTDLNKLGSVKEFPLSDTVKGFNFDLYRAYVDGLKKDTLSLTHFGETLIQGKVNLPEDKIMFLSVPFDGGWTLKVDGQVRKKIILNAGMTGIPLTKGQHTIEMSYELRYFMKGVYLCIVGMLLYIGFYFWTKMQKKKGDTADSTVSV